MAAPKRELLLETAEAIFSKEGFKGVSVDRLLVDAGVAKMTLYKGFESKNALICETLRRRGDRLAAHLENYIERAGSEPTKQILSCFEAMDAWSQRPDFNGCYFISALTEHDRIEGEIGQIAHQYKQRFLERLKSLCKPLSLADSDKLAHSMLILIEGATITHMSLGHKDSYAHAKSIAKKLLI